MISLEQLHLSLSLSLLVGHHDSVVMVMSDSHLAGTGVVEGLRVGSCLFPDPMELMLLWHLKRALWRVDMDEASKALGAEAVRTFF